jgi:hypothetical protein
MFKTIPIFITLAALQISSFGCETRKGVMSFQAATEDFKLDFRMTEDANLGDYRIVVEITNTSPGEMSFPYPYPQPIPEPTDRCQLWLWKGQNQLKKWSSFIPGAKIKYIPLNPGETMRVEGLTLAHFGYHDVAHDYYKDMGSLELEFYYDPSPLQRQGAFIHVRKRFPAWTNTKYPPPSTPSLVRWPVNYKIINAHGEVIQKGDIYSVK